MSGRTVVLVVLALVFGLASAAMVMLFMNRGGPDPGGNKVDVVVAAGDIEPGVILRANMLTTKPFSKDVVPIGAITSIKEAEKRTALLKLSKGELILKKMVTDPGQNSVESKIKPGMRAYSIRVVDEAAALDSLILPHSRADVIWTIRTRGKVDDEDAALTDFTSRSITLVQNVELLAVGQVTQRENKKEAKRTTSSRVRTVTLLVTPDEVAKLKLAQYEGELYLSMRNPEDTEKIKDAPTVSVLDLLNDPTGSGKPLEDSDPRLRKLQEQLDTLNQQLTRREAGVPGTDPTVVVAPAPQYVTIRTWRGGVTGEVQVKLPPKSPAKQDGPL